MLERLFGNVVIEQILFFLLANEQGYATEISKSLHIPLYSVQIALARLEKGGIIARQSRGKTKNYQFNPRYPFLEELLAFLQKVYDSIPIRIRENSYEQPVRKRPRRKGKPL